MKKVFIILITAISLTSCYRDVERIKKDAPQFLKERGYKIVSYDGYEAEPISGGFVAYQVKDSSNYLYTLEVQEWRGELHIYNQTCLNAVKNSK